MRTTWSVISAALVGCGCAGHPAADGGSEATAPRLIAPLSMSTVTQQRPTLRWVNGAGPPVVELCRDHACATPMSAEVQIAADGRSAIPTGALEPGWVYWRVRAGSGPLMQTSATWQFWVGTASASSAVDTSNGAILDVNGDGFADFLDADPAASPGGVVHLYLGSASPSMDGWHGARRIDLISPDIAGARFGQSLASAGDVNGDGYGDFIVGTPGGGAHVYLGSAVPDPAAWNGASAAARIDLLEPQLPPIPDPLFAWSVAGVGDVDGDGYADFAVGTPDAAASSGAVFIYRGSAYPDASAWNGAGAAGRIDVIAPRMFTTFGIEVSGAGDVNGDGLGDFLVGGEGILDPSPAYLYLGAAGVDSARWNGSAPARIELDSPDANVPPAAHFEFGRTLHSAGDVNNDGYADFLIGTFNANTLAGAAHVYLGSAAPGGAAWNGVTAAQRIDLTSIDGGSSNFGVWLAGIGDVNGDGYGDFEVSGSTAHVYFGSATPAASDWNDLSSQRRVDLVAPAGADSTLDGAALGTGDVNGDGHPDFLMLGDLIVGRDVSRLVYIYLGGPSAGATTWNGAAATGRIAVTDPTAGH